MEPGKLAAPFMKIKDACAATGLSCYFLRQGCRNGSVPHIKSGPTYYVNVPALLEQLGVNATVRRRLGSDISAACGQLRREAREEAQG